MSSEISVLSMEVVRGIIWFCYKLGDTQRVAHDKIKVAYGEDKVSLQTVYNWYDHFARGVTAVSDKQRSGRPRISESVEAVSLVLQDQPMHHHIISPLKQGSRKQLSSGSSTRTSSCITFLSDGFLMHFLQSKKLSGKLLHKIFLLSLTA